MSTKPKHDYYAVCSQPRTKAKHEVDEELTKVLTENYRTLPSFEKTFFEHNHIKHYSLRRNELLRCRWAQCKAHVEDRVREPFNFPDNRDLHFYNGSIRFLPQLSNHRIPNFRMKLQPGPGVDLRGQMPIPQELLMKRGSVEKEAIGAKKEKKTMNKGENYQNITEKRTS